MFDVADDVIREHPDEKHKIIMQKTDVKYCFKSVFIMMN